MVRWLWWFSMFSFLGVGSAQPVDSTLWQLVQGIHPDTVSSYILHLSAFGTRAYLSDSVQAARVWIGQQFAARMDTTYEQIFFYNNTQQANVIARKFGTDPSLPRLVVGAHYDDQPWSGPAPGADDNASGVALLLTLADLLTHVQVQRTVELVAFAAEEPGLVGSTQYANRLQNLNDTLFLYLNADMIGGDADLANTRIIVERDEGGVPENNAPSYVYADTLRQMYANYTTLSTITGPIYASDYMPLEALGLVTLGVFEDHWNSTYHTSGDVLDSMDVTYATEVIRGVAAFVLTLAGYSPVEVQEPSQRRGSLVLKVRPAGDGLWILAPERLVRLDVLDGMGRRVRTRALGGVQELRLKLSSLPAGVYWLRLASNQGHFWIHPWVQISQRR
jgi:hypothetical protein